VYKNKQVSDFKIILWLENNKYNVQIEKYAEIKHFSLSNEILNTGFIKDYTYKFVGITYYSDFVRT
jgi:hypothetical protein